MSMKHKGLMIILDGVGDRPAPLLGGATPLEAAYTPYLDRLVSAGVCGLVDPLAPGIPVGAHTGTGLLLGLTLKDVKRLARGPVEAAGVGLPIQPGDVAIRCNFATLKKDNEGFSIVNRRAGRIREGTQTLAAALNNIPLRHGIIATLRPATEHRAVLRLSGSGLSAVISDTDPGAGASHPRVLLSQPLKTDDSGGEKTARALNHLIKEAFERLQDHPVNLQREAAGLLPANGIITRGAGMVRKVQNIPKHLALKVALITGERTVVGLGRLFTYTTINGPGFTGSCDTDLGAKVSAAQEALDGHDLVFLHIKGADLCAHDRDPAGKKAFLERIDEALAPILRDDLVIGVSGDHSTDSNSGRHCGDPVPAILCAPNGRRDSMAAFGEVACMKGGMGRITANNFLLSLLDSMGCLQNFRPIDKGLLLSD